MRPRKEEGTRRIPPIRRTKAFEGRVPACLLIESGVNAQDVIPAVRASRNAPPACQR